MSVGFIHLLTCVLSAQDSIEANFGDFGVGSTAYALQGDITSP